MNDLLDQVLRDSELRIQRLQEKMEAFKKDPMILVTDIFASDDLFLPRLIQDYGDDALLDIQEYWYGSFIPKFREYLGVDDVFLSYNKEIYPAPLNIHLSEELVAVIDIVSHQFEQFEEEAVLREKEELHKINQDIVLVKTELEEKERAVMNPFLLGGSNVVKLAAISFRQNKYKKLAGAEVRELQEYLFELERDRLRTESNVEQIKRMNIEREYALERIVNRIATLPGYAGVLLQSDEIEEGFSMEGTNNEEEEIEWQGGFKL